MHSFNPQTDSYIGRISVYWIKGGSPSQKDRYLTEEVHGISFRGNWLRGACVNDHVCMGVCVSIRISLTGRLKLTSESPSLFSGAAKLKESGLQYPPVVWGAALKVSVGTLLSVRCLRWVLLVGHSLSNSVCSFHLQLSAALNVNYRGTLQLDISPFTLYLKQHAATSKSCGCLWCCKKKELQWSTKNQCNFLEPCFIH